MAKKTCPNGHIYDPNIYGDQCPICPPAMSSPAGSGPATHIGGGGGFSAPAAPAGMHTHVAPAAPGGFAMPGIPGGNDVSGGTAVRPKDAEPQGAVGGGRTVIRHAGAAPGAKAPSRRLVGFLISYNRDPNGRAYNIYEGRNFIGRDASCDISVPDDGQMSGRHFSILYRNVDDKFKFRDEQSSNGTFVNKELLDDGELSNYDIIRAGSTLFIFMAIPKLI